MISTSTGILNVAGLNVAKGASPKAVNVSCVGLFTFVVNSKPVTGTSASAEDSVTSPKDPDKVYPVTGTKAPEKVVTVPCVEVSC